MLRIQTELFDGDHEKVKELNKRVCEKMGFTKWVPVSGQTYSRKLDFKVLSCLSGLAQSAYKMCSDIRLLASMKEIGEFSFTRDFCSPSICLHRCMTVPNLP